MYVLDTSVLSELMKRQPNETFVQRLRRQPSETLYTTAICVMELRYGAWLRPDHELFWKRIMQEILSRVQMLELDEPSALLAGDMLAHLKRVGHPVGLEDVLIGAIARARGYTVITRNLRHFTALPHVKVEDWCAAS